MNKEKEANKKILIVVDMQNDFITGALGSKEAIGILAKVKNKISEYIDNNDEVVFTRDTHTEDYLQTQEGRNLPVRHCIKNTDGWNIHPFIRLVDKMHIDKEAFGFSNWKVLLKEYKEVELIGVCTDICVVSNALIIKALYPETLVTVDASCCAGTTPEKHMAAIEVMKSCQVNIIGEEKWKN